MLEAKWLGTQNRGLADADKKKHKALQTNCFSYAEFIRPALKAWHVFDAYLTWFENAPVELLVISLLAASPVRHDGDVRISNCPCTAPDLGSYEKRLAEFVWKTAFRA